MEKTMERIYLIGGLILLITVIMAMSSCGSSKQCNNKFISENRNW
tara:strand:- start:298 stop:432 length:135 start_codon:yes stop_codon:yes gene_type:complete